MIPSSLLAPPERRALPDWLTLEVAQVSGTVVRSVFFGLFVVLISILIYVLLSKRYGTSASVERYMFVTTSILFLIAFIDWVVDLCRTIEALERFSKSGPLGRIFLRRAAEPTFIIRVLTFALQNAIDLSSVHCVATKQMDYFTAYFPVWSSVRYEYWILKIGHINAFNRNRQKKFGGSLVYDRCRIILSNKRLMHQYEPLFLTRCWPLTPLSSHHNCHIQDRTASSKRWSAILNDLSNDAFHC
ncbi:hypothetical protein BD410DRAFT_357043 [Rickenella mellea]|uniref:Uncharacterized protein n=1 Tax=Rickenella mellea TaxID=50990 RepID=A0A4Y7Q0U4_9AGAM|nr:hypothetical protein BD410DRAFT_357043 [Rickenella mellea]